MNDINANPGKVFEKSLLGGDALLGCEQIPGPPHIGLNSYYSSCHSPHYIEWYTFLLLVNFKFRSTRLEIPFLILPINYVSGIVQKSC